MLVVVAGKVGVAGWKNWSRTRHFGCIGPLALGTRGPLAMGMRQLLWAQRNARRRDRGGRGQNLGLGGHAQQVLHRLQGRRTIDVGQLEESIKGLVDATFLRQCRVEGLHRGVLTFGVDDEFTAGVLRARWSWELMERLHRGRGEFGVQSVVFRVRPQPER